MRMIVTGIKDGKSCLVEERDCSQVPEMDLISMLDLQLDKLAPRPPGQGQLIQTGVAPGALRWFRVRFTPNSVTDKHHTDTIDLHTIIAGSMDLILDDGAHRLQAGDTALVRGVDHGWQAGPDGCLTSIVMLGTPAR